MASVSGPLFSMDASGSIGKTVTYSKWRGRNYVRGHAIPSNPRSTAQRYTRAWMSFLSQAWASIAGVDQATWSALAEGDNLPLFDGYIRGNMNKVKNLQAPSEAYPAAGGGTPMTVTSFTADGEVGQIVGELDPNVLNDGWGAGILVLAGSSPSASRSDIAAVIRTPSTDPVPFVIRNLAPGTYSVSYTLFTVEGLFSAITGDEEVTVT